MKVITAITFFTFFLACAFSNESNKHHHSDSADQHKDTSKTMSLNDGKKWDVDPIMRKNMQAIHEKLEKTKKLIETNNIKDNDYSVLGELILNSAESIATNCKMEPKADSTFHVILGELFSISESLKETKKTKDSIKHLSHVLKKYSNYFNQTF